MSQSKVKTIGILTSGGDAPGMNACIRAVVRAALYNGIKVIGIRRGWNGLINGDVYEMKYEDVHSIINRGGTILYSARSEEFMTKEGRAKAYQTCQLLGLDGLVAIGGDGTFKGCLALSSEYPINVVGIPGTIDNDIGCSHYCIGYDTAANTTIDAIDKICDTMISHERCSVIEVMGHHAGNLALYTGIASGALAVLIPEKPWDFDEDIAKKIRSARLAGRTHFIIVVAEGARPVGAPLESVEHVGNGKAATIVANAIKENLGLDPRVTVLGHIQRGGSPSARDRVTATRMGCHAVKALAEGKNNRVIIHKNGKLHDIDMNEALTIANTLNPDEELVINMMTKAK